MTRRLSTFLCWTTLLIAGFTTPAAAQNATPMSERQYALEQEKLAIEHNKLWIDAAAIAVPLLVAALAGWQAVRNQKSNNQLQTVLKATEIVMNADGPTAAQSRAKTLQQLLGKDLPSSFGHLEKREMGAPGRERKMEVWKMLVDNPGKRKEILAIGCEIFPGTVWLDRLAGKPPKPHDAST